MKRILLILSIAMAGCTDAQVSKTIGIGNHFRIQLINCDGTCTNEWVSTGKVLSEQSSDGYYFTDARTGLLVEVSGNVIITEIPNAK